MKKGARLPGDRRRPDPRRRDPLEVARFLKLQPPIPIPPRTYTQPLPGLIAYGLLGGWIVRGSRQVE